MAKETEKQRQKVLKRYGDLLTGKSRSLPNLELKKVRLGVDVMRDECVRQCVMQNSSPRVENGKCHAETDRDDGNSVVLSSRSPSLSITPVSLPESEWLYILQHTAEKPAIQLRPS